MGAPLKPIFLLADSQPLFRTYHGEHLLDKTLPLFDGAALRAAYIGVSNDNNPAYYQIFTSAMETYAVEECRMIQKSFSTEDKNFLEKAQIIVLSGGDTRKGWLWMKESGVVDILRERYVKGGILIGVSAGAIQLGLCGRMATNNEHIELYDTLRLVPFCIDAHQEKSDWQELKRTLAKSGQPTRAIGLPFGSALIYHSEHQLQPLGPVDEFYLENGHIRHNLLLPENGFAH
ncbi:MAG TPA: peptidase [Caldithrix abyssi]|uniref:Peptidase n=1 Tax=Caldithrix abyssi TaxID=187145 RepID=A0A7V4WU45_CALAY|nr:peptidase [Caldithrix abyssi]